MRDLGERVAALQASFDMSDTYNHDRWHKLNNDLQPLMGLPGNMSRDIGKLEGRLDGKISTLTDKMEIKIEAAIDRALSPVKDEIAYLKECDDKHNDRIEKLEQFKTQWTTARMFTIYAVQTVFSIITTLAAMLAIIGKVHL